MPVTIDQFLGHDCELEETELVFGGGPLPGGGHAEDVFIAAFAAFAAGRVREPARRDWAVQLAHLALDQIGDVDSDFSALDIDRCVLALLEAGPREPVSHLCAQGRQGRHELALELGHQLLRWLVREGRLSAAGRQRLARTLAARARPARRGEGSDLLAA